jgi:hypothetical protein
MGNFDDYKTYVVDFDQAIGYGDNDLLENGVSNRQMGNQIYYGLYKVDDNGYT